MSISHSSPLTILLATQSEGKRREFERLGENFQLAFDFVCAPAGLDIEETGATFLENARLKALGYWQKLSQDQGFLKSAPGIDYVLAEDSGLEVMALASLSQQGCFPGVISKRWLNGHPNVTQANLNQALLKLIHEEQANELAGNRSAAYHCAMVLLDVKTGEMIEAQEAMPLLVATAARGEGGFGYDPIMHPVVNGIAMVETVAEISPELKNHLSHRGKAFRQVLKALKISL
ncbi:MAG: non-canonical purine NTP pyrophosphatase [Vampirovibrionales bacterium]|nr:non-canonical purine NTP pyrophosphatase [Vampirovibrionales bacterium]